MYNDRACCACKRNTFAGVRRNFGNEHRIAGIFNRSSGEDNRHFSCGFNAIVCVHIPARLGGLRNAMCQISFRQKSAVTVLHFVHCFDICGCIDEGGLCMDGRGNAQLSHGSAEHACSSCAESGGAAGNSFCLKQKHRDACLKYFIFAFRYLLFPDFDAK